MCVQPYSVSLLRSEGSEVVKWRVALLKRRPRLISICFAGLRGKRAVFLIDGFPKLRPTTRRAGRPFFVWMGTTGSSVESCKSPRDPTRRVKKSRLVLAVSPPSPLRLAPFPRGGRVVGRREAYSSASQRRATSYSVCRSHTRALSL